MDNRKLQADTAMGYLAAAVAEDSDFSIDNIPFGVGEVPMATTLWSKPRCLTAIGQYAVDLSILQDAGAFEDIDGLDGNIFSENTLNAFMDHTPTIWSKVRQRLQDIFLGTNNLLQSNATLQSAALHNLDTVQMHLPVQIGNYTDFYSSREHATNVGTMFRGKDNALNPNWLHLPVGYHGRASTVFCSGQPIVRPSGQLQKDPNDPLQGSVYGPCKLLDFELEVAFFVGNTVHDNQLNGCPLTMKEAKERIFGFVLMNDWSARDIQKWEYVPLGPFTSKNFATSISPWIVTTEALEAYKVETSACMQDNPVPLEYLQDPDYSSYDIQLSVAIQSEFMTEGHVVCRSNYANLYWNAAQQLVHHSVTGCLMKTGDLLGSGTISGTPENSFGSMLELSWKGSKTVALSHDGKGEIRKFLQDGDAVIMKGFCSKAGHGRVGFGECRGKVHPSGDVVKVTAFDEVLVSNNQYVNFKLHHHKNLSISWMIQVALAIKKVCYSVQKESLASLALLPLLECTNSATGKSYTVSGPLAIMKFLDNCFPKSKALFPLDSYEEQVAIEMIDIIRSHNDAWTPVDARPAVASELTRRKLKRIQELIENRKALGCKGPYAMGGFSHGVVDCFLIPYLHDAKTPDIDVMEEFPTLHEIDTVCSGHAVFSSTQPK
jgi:fumarylacetoacetase